MITAFLSGLLYAKGGESKEVVYDEWITHVMLGITNFCNGVPVRILMEFDIQMSTVPDENEEAIAKVVGTRSNDGL